MFKKILGWILILLGSIVVFTLLFGNIPINIGFFVLLIIFLYILYLGIKIVISKDKIKKSNIDEDNISYDLLKRKKIYTNKKLEFLNSKDIVLKNNSINTIDELKKISKEEDMIEFFKELDYNIDKTLNFSWKKSIFFDLNENILIIRDNANLWLYDISSIKDYDITETSTSSIQGNSGKTLVGGLIAGPTGAIIGSSGKKNIKTKTDYFIHIYTNDLSNPVFTFPISPYNIPEYKGVLNIILEK